MAPFRLFFPKLLGMGTKLLGVALSVTLFFLLKPLVETRSPVIIDDGYYYLQIARNVARGLGSTFDGMHATNGYHPLWMWALVPVYWAIPDDPLRAVHVVKVIQALLASGAAFLFHRAARLTMGQYGSVIATMLWMTTSFRMSLSGMEYSLSAVFVAATAWYYLKWFNSEESLPSTSRYLTLSLLLCGAGLSRLDNIFLLLSTGWYVGSRAFKQPSHRLHRKGLLVFLACLLVTFAAYFGYNLRRFGALMPVSGAVKRAWSIRITQSEAGYSSHPVTTTLAAKAKNLRWPFTRLRYPYAVYTGIACFVTPLYWLLFKAKDRLRSRDGRVASTAPLRGWEFFFEAALVQYVCYALWFHGSLTYGQPWYYLIQSMMGALLIGILADAVLNWILVQKRIQYSWHLRWGAGIAAAALVGYVGWSSFRQARNEVIGTIQQPDLPQAEVIGWLHRNTALNATIGAWNAGALGYFSGRRVINLDGLVNSREFYLKNREALCIYFDEVGIDYIVDYMTLERGPSAALPLDYTYRDCKNRFVLEANPQSLTTPPEFRVFRWIKSSQALKDVPSGCEVSSQSLDDKS